MQVGIMKTDGGPHPADYYAAVAASEIVQVEASAAGQDAIQGRKLENQIIDILETAHQKVIDGEQAALDAAHKHLVAPLDPYVHGLKDTVDEVVTAIKNSKWGHVVTADTHNMVAAVVGKHFGTAMTVTRGWHADKHPDNEHAAQFRRNNFGA
jgi:hypothetical protein